ncbi:MAG: hypothetical protein QM758_22765 [Armatimonas sp.]
MRIASFLIGPSCLIGLLATPLVAHAQYFGTETSTVSVSSVNAFPNEAYASQTINYSQTTQFINFVSPTPAKVTARLDIVLVKQSGSTFVLPVTSVSNPTSGYLNISPGLSRTASGSITISNPITTIKSLYASQQGSALPAGTYFYYYRCSGNGSVQMGSSIFTSAGSSARQSQSNFGFNNLH